MPSPDRSSELHSLVPFEWWPGRVGLSSIVRRSRVRCDSMGRLLLTGDCPLQRGVSLYRDWDLRDPTLAAKHADWTFSHITNLEYGNETMDVHWAPPLPGAGAQDAPAFIETLADQWKDSVVYPWPNVMLDLRMIITLANGSATGLSINLSNAVQRGLWREGLSLASVVRVRVYVSATPPPEHKVLCDAPMPNRIRGDYFGTPVEVPPCLHPYVVLTPKDASGSTLYEATPEVQRPGFSGTMEWQRTNHLTWIEHVFSNDVEQRNGLWVRTEKTVVPPRLPGITYL